MKKQLILLASVALIIGCASTPQTDQPQAHIVDDSTEYAHRADCDRSATPKRCVKPNTRIIWPNRAETADKYEASIQGQEYEINECVTPIE